MMYLESISDFFSKHNKIASLLYKSLSNSDELPEIRRVGDKYTIFYRQEYIEVYKTPGGSYTLSVNNIMYDVSNRISKKIWNLLKDIYDDRRFDVDHLEKKFKN